MRGSLFTLLVFTFLSPLNAMAKDITVDSKIRAATVYNDRASLTRFAKVEIPAGAHNIVFTGLPLSMYPDSLRTEGSARSNVIFGAVSYKRESHEDYVVPREKDLNKQITALQDTRKLLQIEKQSLQAGKTFLDNIGKQASKRINEDIAEINLNPESWSGAADTISTKILQNLRASYKADIKTREVNNKITKLQNELRGLRTGQKQSYSVTVPFVADEATTLNIDLSYQLPNVGWRPIYDARLNVKSGALDLVQYGSVWQRTGEDWSDIELTLSTAQPSRGAGLPKLNPNWISLNRPQRAMRKRDFGGGAKLMALSASASIEADKIYDAEESLDEFKQAGFQAAQINNDGFVGEYKITELSNVKADGTMAKLLIGKFKTESAMQVQIKPQLTTEAYLVVKTTLKGENPILAGQVNLFRDGAYIGKSMLPMLRPDDTEDLAFGIDDNVRVKRNTLKNESSETGLISKESVTERHFVTEIQNLHKEAIDIAVIETIPVSQDKRLRVEILKDKTTAGYKADLHDAKGVTQWSKTLKPKETTKINLGWKVHWPKGENVSGL